MVQGGLRPLLARNGPADCNPVVEGCNDVDDTYTCPARSDLCLSHEGCFSFGVQRRADETQSSVLRQ